MSTPRGMSKRRLLARWLGTRVGLACVWAVCALTALVPAASAVGLPFVDLPTAGGIASDAIDSASKAMVEMVGTGVVSLTNEIIKVSDTVGAPQVGSANTWFSASYKRAVGVSLWLMAIAALIAVTAAGVRGKIGEMLGVIFVSIPGAIVAMMLVTVGVQLSLGLVDAMTVYMFKGSVDEIQTFLHNMGTTFASYDGAGGAAASVLAPGLALIIGLLMIVAQLVILAVLILRSALIYIVTLFLPLVLAVQVWPASRHMTRRAVEMLGVLIFSKFAIFACFALGASAAADVLKPAPTKAKPAITAPAVGPSSPRASADPGVGVKPPAVQSAIVGFGVMAAAALSPMLLMSIVPGIAGSFGGGRMSHASHGGPMGVRSATQVMRSTLAGVHTVRRSRSNSHAATTTQARPTTRPPTGSSPSRQSDPTRESAHTPTPTAPTATTTTTAMPASGSASAPGTSPAAAHSLPPSGQSTAASAVDQSSQQGSQRSSPSMPAPAGSPSPDRSADAPASAAASGRPALPAPGAAETSDGFALVNTRQPFSLETT